MSNNLRWLLLVALVSAWTMVVLSSTDKREKLVKAREAGYAQGFKDGVASVNLKSVLVGNQKAANQLCNKWWFGMTVKERTLNKI